MTPQDAEAKAREIVGTTGSLLDKIAAALLDAAADEREKCPERLDGAKHNYTDRWSEPNARRCCSLCLQLEPVAAAIRARGGEVKMKLEDVAYLSPEELERRGLAPPHYILMLDDNHSIGDEQDKPKPDHDNASIDKDTP